MIVVAIFIVVVLVGAFKFFELAPKNYTVIPRVSEISIVGYLPGSDSVEYYTGIAWKKLEGKAQLGNYVLDGDKLLMEFRDKWYNGVREASIIVPLVNAQELHTSVSLVEGPTSRVGIQEMLGSYVNSEFSSQSATLESYILTMSNKIYRKTTKDELKPVKIGSLDGLNLKVLSFTWTPIDVKKEFYIKSPTETKRAIDGLNILSARGMVLTKESGRGLASRIKLDDVCVASL